MEAGEKMIAKMILVTLLVSSCGYLGPDGESRIEIAHDGEGESRFLYGIDPGFCELYDSQREREACADRILEKDFCQKKEDLTEK